MHKLVLAIGLFTLSATNAVAQGAGKTQAQLSATYDAHKGDFDYLLGTWAFTFENQDYGKGQGTWRITRLPEGQLLDEFRVIDDSGRTMFMTITLRAYNASLICGNSWGCTVETGWRTMAPAGASGTKSTSLSEPALRMEFP